MKNFLRDLLIRLRLIGLVRFVRKTIYIVLHYRDYYGMENPPGHYYSPIPSASEVMEYEKTVFPDGGSLPKELPGIVLNEEAQLGLLESFAGFASDIPFGHKRQEGLRYFFGNDLFGYFDGSVYYSFLRYLKPQKVIEVGSGYSSALLLDVNRMFLDSKVQCTFIEPYPERLHSLITDEDRAGAVIIEKKLQDVDPSVFESLGPGDILFIDSSHVMKTNSDVNKLLFQVLPVLKSGVYVHVHDVSYPFEYEKEWVLEMGRAWNEAYALRAFLQYNSEFSIVFYNDFMARFHRDALEKALPLATRESGKSIWLKRV